MSEPQAKYAVTTSGHPNTSGDGAIGATASDAPKEATSTPVCSGETAGAGVEIRDGYEQCLRAVEEESRRIDELQAEVDLMFEFMHAMIIDLGGIRSRYERGKIGAAWNEYVANKTRTK